MVQKKKGNSSNKILLIIPIVVIILGFLGFISLSIRLSPVKPTTKTPTSAPVKFIRTTLTISETPTLPASKDLTIQEEKEILEQAKLMISNNSVGNLTFTVSVKKKIPGYVRLEAIATNQTLDPLTIIFENKNGTWTFVNMGTTFPDLENQVPELFSD